MTRISFKRLDPDLPLPSRTRPGDAAADLPAREDAVVPGGGRALVPTGFAVAIPEGWCGLILPRSGLALKHGISIMNGPGLIDPGYRGELQVILFNSGAEEFLVERGQRIAQLLILPVPDLVYEEVAELPPAPDDRGSPGFRELRLTEHLSPRPSLNPVTKPAGKAAVSTLKRPIAGILSLCAR